MVTIVCTLVLIIACFVEDIPSLRLGTGFGIGLCISVSWAFVTLMYRIKRISVETKSEFYIFLIRTLHYLVILFTTCYVLIFSRRTDTLFLVFYALLCFHWLVFRGECCLSLWEKQLMYPTYQSGQDIYSHPWLSVMFGEHIDAGMLIVSLLMFFNVVVVLYRYSYIGVSIKMFIIIFVYLMNLYFNTNRFQRGTW